MKNSFITIKDIELIKSDSVYSLKSLFIDLSYSESLFDVLPIFNIRIENDFGKLSTMNLYTEDFLRLTLLDAFKNESIQMLKIKHIIYETEGEQQSDIRENNTQIVTLECILSHFNYFNKVRLFYRWENKSLSYILNEALTEIRLPKTSFEIEDSVNKLNFTSAFPIAQLFEYLRINSISNTATPYYLWIKTLTNNEKVVLEFKSIAKKLTEGIKNLKSLYFASDDDSLNIQRMRKPNTNIIIASRREQQLTSELLYFNKLKKNEIQKFDIFTGKVYVKKNTDILDYMDNPSKIPEELEYSNIPTIINIRSTNMNYDTSLDQYWNNFYIDKSMSLFSYIFEINPELDIHIGDVFKLKSLLSSQNNIYSEILSEYLMVTDVVHTITKADSQTNIRTIAMDPAILDTTLKSNQLKREVVFGGDIKV